MVKTHLDISKTRQNIASLSPTEHHRDAYVNLQVTRWRYALRLECSVFKYRQYKISHAVKGTRKTTILQELIFTWLEKTDPKFITDGESDRRARKDRGKPGCWNPFRSLSTEANTQFDFSFATNYVINIRSVSEEQHPWDLVWKVESKGISGLLSSHYLGR